MKLNMEIAIRLEIHFYHHSFTMISFSDNTPGMSTPWNFASKITAWKHLAIELLIIAWRFNLSVSRILSSFSSSVKNTCTW